MGLPRCDHGFALRADPGYFDDICKTLKVKPEDTLLIDDNENNNKAARDVGVDAPGYKNPAQINSYLLNAEIV